LDSWAICFAIDGLWMLEKEIGRTQKIKIQAIILILMRTLASL
jgi:hypothetical protein